MRYLVLGMLLVGAGSLEAQVTGEKSTPVIQAITVEDAMVTLRTLSNQPAPATLSSADLAAYQQQTEWLKSVLTRLETTAGVTNPRDAATGQVTEKRQHKPIIFTREMAALQAVLLQEGSLYTTVSNVLKSRHDLAMNSIRNMK